MNKLDDRFLDFWIMHKKILCLQILNFEEKNEQQKNWIKKKR